MLFEKLKKAMVFLGRYIFRHSRNTIKVVGALSLSLMNSVLNALPIIAAKYLNSKGENVGSWLIQRVFIGLNTAFLLNKLLAKLRNAVVMPVSTDVQNEMSLDILRKCFDFPLALYNRTRAGEFTRTQSSAQFVVPTIIPTVFGEIIPFGMDVVVIAGSFYLYGSLLASIPLVTLLNHSLVSLMLIKPSNRAKLESRNKAFIGIGKLIEALMAYRPAHQFGRIDYEVNKVLPSLEESEWQRLKAFQIDNLTSALQIIFNYAGLGLTFFYGGILYSRQEITVYDFAAISYLMFNLSSKLEALSPSFITLQAAYLEFLKIVDFFDQPSQENPNSYPLQLNFVPSISFENVNFAYGAPEQSSQLKNITFNIEPGRTFAIIGQSGSGKSTIIELLLRFYDINEGEGKITIDGTDIQKISLKSLRDHIGIVPQEPYIFLGTVRENIQYGRLDATDEEIETVAKWAGLLGEVDLDFNVGVGGKQLSGGQRQRIGIARLFLKGSLVLIFDEATTALDPEKELEVQRNICQLKKGVTTIIVTHKLYTLKTGVDQILYMEKGEIIEAGTFGELLNNKGRFYEQYLIQCKELGIEFDENFKQLSQGLEDQIGNTDELPYYSITQAFFNRKNKEEQEFLIGDPVSKIGLIEITSSIGKRQIN